MQCRKDYMKTLPLLEGAKAIVIDEGLNAMHSRALITGWIRMWIEKDSNYIIDLLSFCDPKFWYDNEPEPFRSKNIHLHDYYTVDIDKAAKEDLESLKCILENAKTDFQNIVIVDCLSSLILYVGLAKALWFIEKLNGQVSQLICIYRRDFVQNRIPSIETLGTTYVKLEEFTETSPTNNLVYKATLIHRKLGGSIIYQTELISQDNTNFQINAASIMMPSGRESNQANKNQPVKIESSFRIEMSAQEIQQRDKTPLPYTLNPTSKIHYIPDNIDNIDEDDPDDDLCL